MRATFAIAALAGSAIAAPSYPVNEVKNVHVVMETVVKTVYVTEGYEIPKPTPEAYPVYSAPAVVTSVVEQPKPAKPTPAPEAPKPKPKPEAPAYTPPAYTPPVYTPPVYSPPASSGPDYMHVVTKWRNLVAPGHPLEYSSELEANAKKTCVDGNGRMVHQLNSGSNAQVLAPAAEDKFEYTFVGGWLCEMASLPGLGRAVCGGDMTKGWDYAGQTGHAEILSNSDYSKIGCGWADGIWGCDLA